jgi:hypothetical protein
MVESSRQISGKTEQETRFYITSPARVAALLGPVVRSHWAIENSLHWVMDMLCSSATTSAASESITRRPTSPPSNTWPITCYAGRRKRVCCAADAKPRHGMTTSWRVSSPREMFTRFPWRFGPILPFCVNAACAEPLAIPTVFECGCI